MATGTPPTTIRLSADDRELIEQLKKRFGIRATQVIRLALRMLSNSRSVRRSGVHRRRRKQIAEHCVMRIWYSTRFARSNGRNSDSIGCIGLFRKQQVVGSTPDHRLQ